jgi:SAM-dependent methyltransferase
MLLGGSVRNYLLRLATLTFARNRADILELIRDERHDRICDLGCGDADWTARVAERAEAGLAVGLDISMEALWAAAKRLPVVRGDLTRPLPFPDRSFDLVHSNQVIEHVPDIDLFTAEIRRVLRPEGVAIVSTENLSSWHNVFAAALGWQPFSLSNVSCFSGGLGNPLALHRASGREPADGSRSHLRHRTVLAYRGLLELLEAHGLRVERVLGAGYHPLPPGLARLDPVHAHLLAVKARRIDRTDAI